MIVDKHTSRENFSLKITEKLFDYNICFREEIPIANKTCEFGQIFTKLTIMN